MLVAGEADHAFDPLFADEVEELVAFAQVCAPGDSVLRGQRPACAGNEDLERRAARAQRVLEPLLLALAEHGARGAVGRGLRRAMIPSIEEEEIDSAVCVLKEDSRCA